LNACPSATEIAEIIRGHIEKENFYKGLKSSRNLIAHEVRTLDEFNNGMDKLSQIAQDVEKEEAEATNDDEQETTGT